MIELIVVVAIIMILATIIIPTYYKSVERARIVEAVTTLKAIHGAQMRYALENDAYTDKTQDLDINIDWDGKYFYFIAFYTISNPDPKSNDNEILSVARRIDNKNYFRDAYNIFINETGAIWSNNIKVDSILGNN